MIRANFHTHSTFCDGRNTPQQMVDRALELGFVALGFSGHMDPEVVMDWPAYSAEVKRLAADPRVKNAVLVAHLAEVYRSGRELPAFIAGGGSIPAAAEKGAGGMQEARAKLEALLKN